MPPNQLDMHHRRTRSQLLDAALEHLGGKYYTRLSKNDKCKIGKYIHSRAGEILEGAITFQQDTGRHVLVSVTAFDVAQSEQRRDWLNAKIHIPQPNRFFLFIESAIAGLLVFAGLMAYGTLEGALSMALFTSLIYYIGYIIRVADLGRELRQSPNLSLYHFIPDSRLPAHECWLVIGEEIFENTPQIDPQALSNLCQNEGIGLLVILQNRKPRVWNHPKHKDRLFETKFNERLPDLFNN